jgi:AcrR family transcriptional regulator
MMYILEEMKRKKEQVGLLPDPEPGKRARTRGTLIEAAAAVIGEKGFDRASLEEIAARAGMTRGAVYGNFKDKDELFFAVIESFWKPIIPPFRPGASLKQQMRILGETVAREARIRQPYASAAAAFQLYALTHKQVRQTLTEKNEASYKWFARELVKVIPARELPMPAEQFVRVLDTMITGLLFTYFQTPNLITEDIFLSAFEGLA